MPNNMENLLKPVLYAATVFAHSKLKVLCSQIKRRVRLELLRWHEDKFAKFRDRLAKPDVDRILAQVKAVTQILNSIST